MSSSPAAAAGLAAEDHVFPAPAVDAPATDAAIAPNGFAAAAWVETLAGGQSRVDVSVRPPGGDWSAFQPLGVTTLTVSERLPRPSWNFGDDGPGVIVTQ